MRLIRVEKRLPETEGTYLGWWNDGEGCEGWALVYYEPGSGWFNVPDNKVLNVTCWAALPAQPRRLLRSVKLSQ